MTDYTLRVLVTAKNKEAARELASELNEYVTPDGSKIVDVYVEDGWDD